MEDIANGFWQALQLIVGGDTETWEIVLRSLYVTSVALLFSTVVGIPLGAWLGLTSFRGKPIIIALIYTGMGFPPVVVGLFVYLLLSRSGPLGMLGWLFTPSAMILAQTVISFPLVAGFTMAAVLGVDPDLRTQLRSLGATTTQATLAVLWEARVGVVISLIAGFGSIISEVGAVMLVGGNIRGSTRVLTTAIVLETRKGQFDLAIALALILLAIMLLINVLVLRLQGRLD